MQDTLPSTSITPTPAAQPNTLSTPDGSEQDAIPEYTNKIESTDNRSNYITTNTMHKESDTPTPNNTSTEFTLQTNEVHVEIHDPGEITKGDPSLTVTPSSTPTPSIIYLSTPLPGYSNSFVTPEALALASSTTPIPLATPLPLDSTPIPPGSPTPTSISTPAPISIATSTPIPTPIPSETPTPTPTPTIVPESSFQPENFTSTSASIPATSLPASSLPPATTTTTSTTSSVQPTISQTTLVQPTATIVHPITPSVGIASEIKSDAESDKPERQPYASSSKNNRRFSTFVEPPMPVEHKKDRLRHHVKLAHKKNTLGETIYKGHPSWLLMRDIQTGLYTNIKNMAQRTQDPDLFHTPPVTVLPMVPNAQFTFKFKDYCPMAFYNLREHFGINHVDYVTSLCQNWNEVGTPGKSGSLFFFSLDNQYVLKTIPKREAKILRELLPAYYRHMTTNPNSLLTKFMGLHRVKPHKGRQVRFLVMGNLFNSNLRIHQRFDLKGSTVGRELSAAERAKKNPTFKDLDFRRLNRKLHFGANRDVLLKQLQADTDFLYSQHIMDYSLLVGIHFMQQQEDPGSDDEDAEVEDFEEPVVMRTPPLNRSLAELPPYVPDTEIRQTYHALSIFEREEGGMRARSLDGTPLEEYYYIGVIDILMHYSFRKQVEHAAKRILHPRGEISSVEPHLFATRFMKFAVEIVD